MSQTSQQVSVNREYKDRLFRKIFGDGKALLTLYNAINHTNYDNPQELEINTMENVVYMSMRNDISFIIDGELNLYEHQSTKNPNMPLRNLFHIARVYEATLYGKSIYSSRIVTLPTPHFIVFYNGKRNAPEEEVLKLSSAFLKQDGEPELELQVRVLNINKGFNQELLEQCKLLKDYVLYVTKVRSYAQEMSIEAAVTLAIDESLEEGILTEFLSKYRREAFQMSIFEYNEEREMELFRRAEREQAKEELREEVKEQVREEIKEQARDEIKEQVREEIKEQAREEVKEQVREEIKEEVKKETVLNLDKMGISVEQIAEATKVNIDIITEWIKENTDV